MDSQRIVDHLRDEAAARKDTTLGDLMDRAAEELDEAEDLLETAKAAENSLNMELKYRDDMIERVKTERTFWHEKWRRDWQALEQARTEVKRLKAENEQLAKDCRGYLANV